MRWDMKKYLMHTGGMNQYYPDMNSGMPFLSKAVAVGNLVFLSVVNGADLKTGHLPSGRFDDQLICCLNSLKVALEESGSLLDNIVKNIILIKNVEDCSMMWKGMFDYYQEYAPGLIKEPPAVTVIPVKSFFDPACLIEIDTLAAISKDEPGWEMKKFPAKYKDPPHVYSGVDLNMKLFSESVAVGNLLFLSGMSGTDPETGKVETKDFETQMDIGFDKIREALDRHGSSVCNIIKTWHLLAGLETILMPSQHGNVSHSPASDRLWKRELEHYDVYAPALLDDFPASTFLKLPSLGVPGSLAEVDVTGVISLNRPGWQVKKYPLYYGQRGFPRHIGEMKKYYSNSVTAGNLVFVSGQTPTDKFTGRIEADSFEEQVKVALDNLRTAMEETGSSLSNLVKTYVLMPDLENYPTMRRLELEFYQKYAPALVAEPPASTVIGPLNLASPRMLIEIDAIGLSV